MKTAWILCWDIYYWQMFTKELMSSDNLGVEKDLKASPAVSVNKCCFTYIILREELHPSYRQGRQQEVPHRPGLESETSRLVVCDLAKLLRLSEPHPSHKYNEGLAPTTGWGWGQNDDKYTIPWWWVMSAPLSLPSCSITPQGTGSWESELVQVYKWNG